MTFEQYYNSVDWQLTMKPMAEDMFLAGAASRDEEVEKLKAELKLYCESGRLKLIEPIGGGNETLRNKKSYGVCWIP